MDSRNLVSYRGSLLFLGFQVRESYSHSATDYKAYLAFFMG